MLDLGLLKISFSLISGPAWSSSPVGRYPNPFFKTCWPKLTLKKLTFPKISINIIISNNPYKLQTSFYQEVHQIQNFLYVTEMVTARGLSQALAIQVFLKILSYSNLRVSRYLLIDIHISYL